MNKNSVGFAVTGGLMCILFFVIANLTINDMAGVSQIWFIYPVFAVIWWPMTMIACYKGSFKGYSVVSSVLIIAFLTIVNYVTSPAHPWVLYAAYPVIWWPISIFAGRRAATLRFAVICSGATILYYSLLNLLISPQYPWAIYPAFALLWWPISMYFARKKKYLAYSVVCSFLSILFFMVVNYVSSPHEVWGIYPIFGILWWPLSMYYYYHRRKIA